MSSIFCCRSPRTESPDHFNDANLHTLRPASVESVAPPASRVPRDSSPVSTAPALEDLQAIRDIFNTPSSVRGYQAARSKASTPLSTDFKLLRRSPAKSPSKIEVFSHHVMQRLSDTRLSKKSSAMSVKGGRARDQHVQRGKEGTSHTSTGLSDLLISRTASEGGYDSDARGIQTPDWRSQSNPGSVNVSPEFLANALRSLESSPRTITSISQSQKQAKDYSLPYRGASQSQPCTPTKERSAAETEGTEEHPRRQRSNRASPTPTNALSPTRASFSALLQLGYNDSPTDVLRRLSEGVPKGTASLPETAELEALKLPSLSETGQEWTLAFSAPRRAASLSRSDQGGGQVFQALGDRVERAKGDNFASSSDNGKASFVSNLDPTLLEYIRRFDEELSQGQLQEHGQKIDSEGGRSEGKEGGEGASHVEGARGLAGITSLPNKADIMPEESNELTPSVSRPDSDHDSIHLQNMRISQRLASRSVMPMLSSSSSNLGSSHGCKISTEVAGPRQSLNLSDRRPVWIAREHNRMPSDPKTRELFEKATEDDRLYSKPRIITNANSFATNSEKLGVRRDDASSFYMSDGDIPGSDSASLSTNKPKTSTRNPNSIAIGGRHDSIGCLSNADEAPWLWRSNSRTKQGSEEIWRLGEKSLQSIFTRERKQSAPKHNTFTEGLVNSWQRVRRRGQTSTEANEVMSEVGVAEVLEKRHEKMSEVDPTLLVHGTRGQAENGATRSTSEGWLTQGRRSGWGYDFAEGSPSETQKGSPDENTSKLRRDEPISDMWGRVLRKARDEQTHDGSIQSFGGLLAVPGQGSRRRGSISQPNEGPEQDRRSKGDQWRSADDGSQRSRESFSLDEHQRICAEARKPLARIMTGVTIEENNGKRRRSMAVKATQRGDSKTTPTKETPKKGSLLDMRRFTTSDLSQHKSCSASPIRDFLSWARFPSHNRAERTGPAGDKDGVRTRDFSPPTITEDNNESQLSLMARSNISTTNLGLHTPGSWRMLAFKSKKNKSRSMTFSKQSSPIPKDPFKRKSLLWQLKHLYRSQSSDLRRYRAGHRSSVTMGGLVKYPELEIIPGLPGLDHRVPYGYEFRRPSTPTPGQSGRESLELDDGLDKMEVASGGPESPYQKVKSAMSDISWSRAYADCVGEWPGSSPTELSISDRDGDRGRGEDSYVTIGASDKYLLGSGSGSGSWRVRDKRIDGVQPTHACGRMASTELRESTVDFRERLMREEEKSREGLLRKVQEFGEIQVDVKEVTGKELEAPPKTCDLLVGAKGDSFEDVSRVAELGGVETYSD